MKKTNKPLISLVIPIYNVEAYLRRCLDSVHSQTYSEFEVLLIDDGSTDESAKICDEFAADNKRFKVKHKKNAGTNYARRDGVKIAKGSYIAFIDGDDYVHPDYLKTLLQAIQETSADIAYCLEKAVSDEYSPSFSSEYQYPHIVATASKLELLSAVVGTDRANFGKRGQLWGALYSRELFADVDWKFSNVPTGEDIRTVFQVYFKVDNAVQIEEELYFYVQRASSTGHSNDFGIPYTSLFETVKHWREKLAEQGIYAMEEELEAREINNRFYVLNSYVDQDDGPLFAMLRMWFKRNSKEILVNSKISRQNLFQLRVLQISGSMYKLLRKAFIRLNADKSRKV